MCREAGSDEWPIGVSHYKILGLIGSVLSILYWRIIGLLCKCV